MNVFHTLLNYITAPFRFLTRVPSYLVTTPGKLLGMSLPMRVALSLAFFLILCTVIAWIAQTRSRTQAELANYWILCVLAIVIIAPLVAYHAVRLWLVGDV